MNWYLYFMKSKGKIDRLIWESSDKKAAKKYIATKLIGVPKVMR